MSTFNPNVSWEDFKKIADAGKLGLLKSCEVEIDGYTFTAIIPTGDTFTKDYARTQADFLALRSNSVGGLYPGEILVENIPEMPGEVEVKSIPEMPGKVEVESIPEYPNLVKAREARRLKRQQQAVVRV